MTENNEKIRINPNTASDDQLQMLTGVGPGLAERIRQGRPYNQIEDLLGISGVGQGSLDRWADRLTFDFETEEVQTNNQTDDKKTTAKQPTGKSETKVEAANVARQSSSTLIWMLLAIIISIFLSVSLTLGILLSINGTLNTGRHAQVQALSRQLAQSEADLADLNNQLAGVEQRLAALQGLSGRMGEVEDHIGELQVQVEQATNSVNSMSERFDAMEEITQSLSSRVDRFDQFLDGLRELLNQDSDLSLPDAQQEETPSQ